MVQSLLIKTPIWFKTFLLAVLAITLGMIAQRGITQYDHTTLTYDVMFRDHEKRITTLEQMSKDISKLDQKVDRIMELLIQKR